MVAVAKVEVGPNGEPHPHLMVVKSGPNHREDFPGVKRLHTNRDIVFAFTGEAFLCNLDYLRDQFVYSSHRNIGWSMEYSRELATKGLGVDQLTRRAPITEETIGLIIDDPLKRRRIPSVMLFRPENGEPGRYIGISAQRMFYPYVSRGEEEPEQEEAVLYHILRAFDRDRRGKQRGRTSVELGLLLHQDARWYGHRTGSHVAAYTNTRSEALDQTHSHPWKEGFTEDPLAWAIVKKMYDILGNRTGIDEFGVSRGEYKEPNKAVEIRKEHEGSMRIWRKMFQEFGMTLYDAVFPLYRVK